MTPRFIVFFYYSGVPSYGSFWTSLGVEEEDIKTMTITSERFALVVSEMSTPNGLLVSAHE